MKRAGLKSAGCVLRTKGWYKDGEFLGKTTKTARNALAKLQPKRRRKQSRGST